MQWAEIENVVGRENIYSNFLINARKSATSIIEKALDCMTCLICHDFDHKASSEWNKSNEFDIRIAQDQTSLSL